ncbi:MAG TPA: energy transducer TonB [Terriglobales bacterium]|nr:energy transducer TonB [Terriglobales bacterium]
MNSQVDLTLGLLPEPGTRWGRFVFSYGVQSLVLAVFVIMAVAHPEILVMPIHDYHFIGLVNTPPPVPQQPAPLKNFPTPKMAEVATPRPQALRVPAELVPPKKALVTDVQPPSVTLAASKALIPEAKPVIPRQLVKTNVFSNGSSATPTMAAAPSKVQTGGFGDPNGVPAQENHGRPVTIASAGSFDMPIGPGYGNGTGGSHGVRGVVASAGFGSGVATGDNSGVVSASRGTVRQGSFGDADIVTNTTPKTKSAESAVRSIPAEITFKPRPVYTDEGRQLKVEGEVLIDVVFAADGQIHVVRVVQGLGHGLDESAVRAAQKIQFKPALKDGRPADFEAVVHVVFQLAS